MIIPILYEDGELLVINKPPSVVVNRAESVKGETVQDWVETRDYYTQYASIAVTRDFSDSTTEFISRSGVVHRIDKETSGILLIAKNPESFLAMKQQFMDRSITKTYIAFVHGIPEPMDGEIHAPIGRLPWNRERFGVIPDGREAVTKYHVTESFRSGNREDDWAIVSCFPKTGRTHQIRVHMAYTNHPILGDFLYAGRKRSRDDRLTIPRIMLHASAVHCTHPKTGQDLEFAAPIPDDMIKVRSMLQQ